MLTSPADGFIVPKNPITSNAIKLVVTPKATPVAIIMHDA
ncbi:unannotated protein [freshwater metagenome]|uniref:Unannotated protein n=1 Tax=freshwater metagenome TaxID=449393 RepID=A0A6J7GKP0_9ZZZZ